MGEAVVSAPQADPSVHCGTGIPGGSTRTTGSFDAARPAPTSKPVTDLVAARTRPAGDSTPAGSCHGSRSHPRRTQGPRVLRRWPVRRRPTGR
ncbi:hypothetical protein CTZ28_11515 [Streptomyces shenzhenensis]|uniref:Uncharacterized protein n=1 Tax=Streptomyces shenzhenensis TaxID=943815 RepID=A0A3M0I9B6_9ACTN|nr:hypothetical protein CTZ28_11515 [Streptomyces shenzhenensis]